MRSYARRFEVFIGVSVVYVADVDVIGVGSLADAYPRIICPIARRYGLRFGIVVVGRLSGKGEHGYGLIDFNSERNFRILGAVRSARRSYRNHRVAVYAETV